ncbi:MFS transporter [Nocardia stercoris]|uniref:MFS transporter n=1 Tax=Nocardia stercoris TaxID=2483361 RepID=A0A3M2LE33_9NOCA|nr:MFS transporter [Nocardia stercoris]RMI35807.1 MFS transporter [Nocardia stercoris]
MVGAGFLIALGFGLVAPVLPQYARSFGVGVAAASGIVSAFALMRLLFAPVSGRLVQRLGEPRIYLSGVLIVAVSTGACAVAQSYWQLIVLRALGGVGSTMFTVSSLGLVIRLSPPGQRGRVSGLWSTSFLIGSLGGPLIGGALAGLGLRAPFVIYAIALVAATAVVYFSLRNSRLSDRPTVRPAAVLGFGTALRRPAYRAVLVSNFVNGVAVLGVRTALLPLVVVETLHRSRGMAGVALTAFAAGNAAVLFLAGRWSDRWGRKPFMIAGCLVCAAGTAGVGIAPELWALLAASFVGGVGSGLFTPAQQATVADVLGPDARGGPVLAGYQMAGDLGTVLGPIVIGALVQRVSFEFGFVVTGVLLVTAAVWWALVPEPTARITTPHDSPVDAAAHPVDAGSGT